MDEVGTMSRHDHPAFVTARTQNRHLRLVEPPAQHADPCGNAIVGAFWGVLFTGAIVGLLALAVWA